MGNLAGTFIMCIWHEGSDLTCMVNFGNRVCEGDALFAVRVGR